MVVVEPKRLVEDVPVEVAVDPKRLVPVVVGVAGLGVPNKDVDVDAAGAAAGDPKLKAVDVVLVAGVAPAFVVFPKRLVDGEAAPVVVVGVEGVVVVDPKEKPVEVEVFVVLLPPKTVLAPHVTPAAIGLLA